MPNVFELSLLPDNALIVNTARSWVMDQDKLLAELHGDPLLVCSLLYGAALRPWLAGMAPSKAYATLFFTGEGMLPAHHFSSLDSEKLSRTQQVWARVTEVLGPPGYRRP